MSDPVRHTKVYAMNNTPRPKRRPFAPLARPLVYLSLACLTATLTGCATRQPEVHRGRVDPRTTTRAEMNSPKIQPKALLEFADQMPQVLAQRLMTAPKIRDTPGQVTVVMGDIANNTHIVSSLDFEMMVQRMRSNLLASQHMRDRIQFVEDPERLRAIAARQGVEVNIPQRPAETTYALTADTFRVGRGNTSLYYMQVQVSHFGSGAIVFNDRFELKQLHR